MNLNSDGTDKTVPELIVNIIRREMDLDADRVIVYNQDFMIPPIDGIFVVVEYKGGRPFSSRNKAEDEDGVYKETQSINTLEMIAVEIMSKNMEALQRKEEVLMAINSIYAQSLQEANNFRIARISPIENLSQLEGAALLYRFGISLSIFAWYEKVKTAAFFETFKGEVRTENKTKEFEPTLN